MHSWRASRPTHVLLTTIPLLLAFLDYLKSKAHRCLSAMQGRESGFILFLISGEVEVVVDLPDSDDPVSPWNLEAIQWRFDVMLRSCPGGASQFAPTAPPFRGRQWVLSPHVRGAHSLSYGHGLIGCSSQDVMSAAMAALAGLKPTLKQVRPFCVALVPVAVRQS
jgi:hypothetical protein